MLRHLAIWQNKLAHLSFLSGWINKEQIFYFDISYQCLKPFYSLSLGNAAK
jgi:hypothetical protein